MTSTPSIEDLRGLVEPGPPPIWPPAPGWYAVALVLVALVVWIYIEALRRARQNRYRRLALQELKRIRVSSAVRGKRAKSIASLGDLIKRTALAAYPRSEVACLSGEPWLAFLEEQEPGCNFLEGAGRLLEDGAYRSAESLEDLDPAELADLFGQAQYWILRHRSQTG